MVLVKSAGDVNPLLGFINDDDKSSKEEDDLKARSSKKVKGGTILSRRR